ncbi:MAG: hypothetical protein GX595_01685 [Lentisphaerae bacterium]|nr:hypothetical protein [Lentisphaerota bacterium]
MRRRIVIILASLSTAFAAGLPEAYQVIVQRDIFNPGRTPAAARPRGEPVVAAPVASPDRLSLIGVAIIDGQAQALFVGSRLEWTGRRQPGDELAAGRLVAVDTAGVTLETGPGTTLRLRVGESLTAAAGEPWRLSDGPPPVATMAPAPSADRPAPAGGVTAAASAAAPAAAAPAAASSPEDIIKQMRERRRRELAP